MVESKQFNPLLNPEQIPPAALTELRSLKEILEARNGKKLTGDEYPRHPNGLYRGDLLGVLVATIYTQQGFFYSPLGWRYGSSVSQTETFLEIGMRNSLGVANSGRMGGAQFTATLEERGYDIPLSGAALLEFDPEKITYREHESSYGVLVDKLQVTSLTYYCKQYILDELQLSETSHAYQVLMGKQT